MNDDTVREDTEGTAAPDEATATRTQELPKQPPAPPVPPGPPAPPAPRGPSPTTVVYGLVLTTIALLLLGRELDLFVVDPVESGVALLLGSGALLVVWALVSMVGRRNRDGADDD